MIVMIIEQSVQGVCFLDSFRHINHEQQLIMPLKDLRYYPHI